MTPIRYTAGVTKILTQFPNMITLEGAQDMAIKMGYALLSWKGDIWSCDWDGGIWHRTKLRLEDFEC